MWKTIESLVICSKRRITFQKKRKNIRRTCLKGSLVEMDKRERERNRQTLGERNGVFTSSRVGDSVVMVAVGIQWTIAS